MKNCVTILSVIFCVLVSCKKMIEVGPPKTQLTPDKAFADDQSAISVLSNTYGNFSTLISNSLTPSLGIYTDELSTTSANTTQQQFYSGVLSPGNSAVLNIWTAFYSIVYQCNSLMENLATSPNVTLSTKNQVAGEARLLRAMSYFYLSQLYGGVPLLLTTNVSITSLAPKNTITEIFQQIILDIQFAQSSLPTTYPSPEKVRMNKFVATAFLARVYLFQQKWIQAEAQSDTVILSGLYLPLDNPTTAFVKNSKETILQFWNQNGFVTEAPLFIPSSGSIPTYPLTNTLLSSFESGDNRKSAWISSVTVSGQTYFFPGKYKNRSTTAGVSGEYLMVLRLGEQYLIRAEAKARQNKIIEALSDINIVRQRTALPAISAPVSQDSCLSLIVQERRHEFFCEWGNRFFDLKRLNLLNTIMGQLKPTWQPSASLWPIPSNELLNNPNLVQNQGY